MKKRLLSIFIATTVFGVCACESQSQSAETTTVAVATTTTTAETTTTAAKTTKAVTTTAKTTVATTTATDNAADFRIADYCGAFDNAEPVPYTAITEASATYSEEKKNIAFDLLINSDYYKDVSEYAKETFTYENGEIVYEEYWYNKGFAEYVEYSEAKGFTVTPRFCTAYDISADRTGSEYIFIYCIPMPSFAEMEWSGTADYFMAIYVNHRDEAVLLTDVCYQTLYDTTPLIYNDGAVHVLFNRGHSMGTQCSHIYSFENGEAKLLLNGSLLLTRVNSPFLEANVRLSADSPVFLFFRDKTTDKYTGVATPPASKELIDALCSSEQVIENIPEFKNWCTQNTVYTIGGKYIIMCDPSHDWIRVYDVFSLENGKYVSYGKMYYPNYELCDTDANINLSKYE